MLLKRNRVRKQFFRVISQENCSVNFCHKNIWSIYFPQLRSLKCAFFSFFLFFLPSLLAVTKKNNNSDSLKLYCKCVSVKRTGQSGGGERLRERGQLLQHPLPVRGHREHPRDESQPTEASGRSQKKTRRIFFLISKNAADATALKEEWLKMSPQRDESLILCY